MSEIPPDTLKPSSGRLKKDLNLFDVFAIASGAMFSSGFFLLPGLASAEAGPAVVLAYFLSGLMMVPAMLSNVSASSSWRSGETTCAPIVPIRATD